MQKYHAVKTEYKGVKYDSRKEARRAFELDMLERAKKITNLQRQVRFILQEKYVNNKGEKIREISYIADFLYYDVEKSRWVVEDTKGVKTDVYKIKKKLFEAKFKDYIFLES